MDAYFALISHACEETLRFLDSGPLILLPSAYGLWAVVRPNHLLDWYRRECLNSVFRKGRISVGAWFATLDLEESLGGISDCHIPDFVADVVKSLCWIGRVCLKGSARSILAIMLLYCSGANWLLVWEMVELGLVGSHRFVHSV